MTRQQNSCGNLRIHLLLSMITLLAYWQVSECDFIEFDDGDFIARNPHLEERLTWKGVQWALSADLFSDSPSVDYWQPVTLFSRLVDVQCFGFNPAMHHIVNLVFHVLNTLLVFHIFFRLIHLKIPCAIIAALFAVHPLHVEAVAWITERKEVLSGMFWFLTIWSYIRYVAAPKLKRYLLVLLMFVLGLMAKPVVITLPFILLLLDYWPLNRFRFERKCKQRWSRLLLEKLPLLLISLPIVLITLRWQASHLKPSSFSVLLGNAFVSYATYIVKTIIPISLAIPYPHPGENLAFYEVICSASLLLVITLFSVHQAIQRSHFLVGWLWFLSSLLPVIGLNDIAGADRFTYLPLIGLFIMIVCGVMGMASVTGFYRLIMNSFTGLILLVFMALSWRQVQYWKDSRTLFQHTVEVTQNNYIAHLNLSVALAQQFRNDEAVRHLKRCLEIKPHSVKAHNNLGTIFGVRGNLDSAIEHFVQALQIQPSYAEARYNLAICLWRKRRSQEAIDHLKIVLRLEPNFLQAQRALITLQAQHPLSP